MSGPRARSPGPFGPGFFVPAGCQGSILSCAFRCRKRLNRPSVTDTRECFASEALRPQCREFSGDLCDEIPCPDNTANVYVMDQYTTCYFVSTTRCRLIELQLCRATHSLGGLRALCSFFLMKNPVPPPAGGRCRRKRMRGKAGIARVPWAVCPHWPAPSPLHGPNARPALSLRA